MQCPTFTNVYWELNIKKIRAANGGPPERGAPCHGITGILVNPAMTILDERRRQSDFSLCIRRLKTRWLDIRPPDIHLLLIHLLPVYNLRMNVYLIRRIITDVKLWCHKMAVLAERCSCITKLDCCHDMMSVVCLWRECIVTRRLKLG